MSGGNFTDSPARTNLLSWLALGLTLILLVAACGTTGLDEPATNPPSPTTTQATPEEPSPAPATSTTIKVLGPEMATVASITDGDTIRVILADGSNVPVRLIGIDAPETNDTLTAESTEFLASLLEGQEVYLVPDVSDRDMYDRLLRYVYVGENFINEEMVENGFAVAKEYPPDTAHADELAQAQQRAETQSYGLWSAATTASRQRQPQSLRPQPPPWHRRRPLWPRLRRQHLPRIATPHIPRLASRPECRTLTALEGAGTGRTTSMALSTWWVRTTPTASMGTTTTASAANRSRRSPR